MIMEGAKPIDSRVIRDTRAVLISSHKGISISQFPKDYHKLVGRPFPYRDHGYQSTQAMLRAMEKKGIVRFTKSSNVKDGGWIVFGIPDDNHFMPSWVKKIRKKESSTLDSNGEILLFVRWEYRHRNKLYNHLTVKERKDKLSKLMSKAGMPLQITIAGPQHSFVRFGSCQEARKAIDMFNEYQINDIVYFIEPAEHVKKTATNRMSKHSLVGDICIEDMSPPPWKKISHDTITLSHDLTVQSHNSHVTNHISPPWKKISCDPTTPSHDLTVQSHDSHVTDQIPPWKKISHDLTVKSHDSHVTNDDYYDSESDDDDVTWDETLLYNQTSHVSQNGIKDKGYDHIWSSDLLTRCNGGISWNERISVICGVMTVRITSFTPSMCLWVQVLNTPEMECFVALENYLKNYRLQPLNHTPKLGEIYATSSDIPHQRCCVLQEDDTDPVVFYLDTGEVSVVSISSLLNVPKYYAEFPMMALPCLSQDISLLSLNDHSIIDILMKKHLTVEIKPPVNKCSLPLPLNIHFHDDSLSMISELTTSATCMASPSSCPITPSHTLYSNGTVSPTSIYGNSTSHVCIKNSGSQWILNSVNHNGLVPVYVSEVVSPGLFWIQLTQDPSSDVQWISRMISSDNTPPKLQVCQGEIYAYNNEAMNYRVKIESISEKGEQASVLCVDTGIRLQVSIVHLHTLPSSLILTLLPALALPSCIHGMVPVREDRQWWTLDNQLLWKLIRNKNVYVKFMNKGTSNSLFHNTKFDLDPISLSVYLDPEGWDSVTDLLLQDGHYVDLDPAIKGLNELKIY